MKTKLKIYKVPILGTNETFFLKMFFLMYRFYLFHPSPVTIFKILVFINVTQGQNLLYIYNEQYTNLFK